MDSRGRGSTTAFFLYLKFSVLTISNDLNLPDMWTKFILFTFCKKRKSPRGQGFPRGTECRWRVDPPLNPQLQLTAATRIFFQNRRNCMICFISIVLTSCEKMKLFWWAKPEISMTKNCKTIPKMAENREMTSLAIKWRHHLFETFNIV